MKEIKSNGACWLFIPSKTPESEVTVSKSTIYTINIGSNKHTKIQNPSNNKYVVFANTIDITEKNAFMIVEHKAIVMSMSRYEIYYMDYTVGDYTMNTAEKSLQSMLKANDMNEDNYVILKKEGYGRI